MIPDDPRIDNLSDQYIPSDTGNMLQYDIPCFRVNGPNVIQMFLLLQILGRFELDPQLLINIFNQILTFIHEFNVA